MSCLDRIIWFSLVLYISVELFFGFVCLWLHLASNLIFNLVDTSWISFACIKLSCSVSGSVFYTFLGFISWFHSSFVTPGIKREFFLNLVDTSSISLDHLVLSIWFPCVLYISLPTIFLTLHHFQPIYSYNWGFAMVLFPCQYMLSAVKGVTLSSIKLVIAVSASSVAGLH